MPTVMSNSSPQVFDRPPPADRFSVLLHEEPYSMLPDTGGDRSPILSGNGRHEVLPSTLAPAQKLSGFMARIKEGMSPRILPTSQKWSTVTSPGRSKLQDTPRQLALLKSHKEDRVVSILYHDGTHTICMGFVGTNGRVCSVLPTLYNYTHSKETELDAGWYI